MRIHTYDLGNAKLLLLLLLLLIWLLVVVLQLSLMLLLLLLLLLWWMPLLLPNMQSHIRSFPVTQACGSVLGDSAKCSCTHDDNFLHACSLDLGQIRK